MSTAKCSMRISTLCLALVGALGVSPSTMAAVIGTDAAVTVTVQELIAGSPGSVSTDSDQLLGDRANAPLLVAGSLVSTDLDGQLVSMGQGVSTFEDPTLLDQPNPAEFGLEVAGFANADSVSYVVSGEATESRTIVFTTSGNPVALPEIDFGVLGVQSVESSVFFSGAVILWSTQSDVSLDDLTSDLSITVRRSDTGDAIFATSLSLSGTEDGGIVSTPVGPIVFESIELSDLADEGVDEGSLAVLQQIADSGTLMVVVIPPQEHAYDYTVTADQPVVLTAELTAQVRNAPGGTGVAITLGRPFENLASFIGQGLAGVDGDEFERSLNAITNARSVGLVAAQETPPIGTPSGLCGALGFEALAMLTFGLCTMVRRSRR